MKLKIKEGMKANFSGILDIRPDQIIWINNGSEILLSNNFLNIEKAEDTIAISTEDLLKIIDRITEDTQLVNKEKCLEISIPNKNLHFKTIYQLMKRVIYESNTELIDKLEIKTDPILSWSIDSPLIKEIMEVFTSSSVKLHNNDFLFMSDDRDTILIPKQPPQTESVFKYSYATTLLKNGLTGLINGSSVTLKLFDNGLVKILVGSDDESKFSYYFTTVLD